jgi:cytochrome c5
MKKLEAFMKKHFVLFVVIEFTLGLLAAAQIMVESAYAVKCPEPRKTKSAPTSFVKIKDVVNADKANGKKLFNKTAKPIACKMCHGKTGVWRW